MKSILCFRNRKNSRVFLSKSNQAHTKANSSIRIYKILYQKSTKNEKTPTEWKKILENGMTTKGLISKIYKHFRHFINISIAKKKFNLKNGQKTCIDIFPKKTYRWPARHMKVLDIVNHQRNAN